MKPKNSGNFYVYGSIILIIVIVLGLTGWVKNFFKLSECDFVSPYKCEVVHLIGIIPPIGAVTGWIETETK